MTCRELFITITSVAICAIPATATAHGGNNDPNVVHACIGNINKVVRIVGASDTCLSTPPPLAETPAHWNIQGPQGPQGVQGPQGPQGTNGINGTNGGRPAPPCFDNNKRYVDCGNGTVTDTDTGLVWLQDAACLGGADWAAANTTAAALAHGQCGLTDGSSAGDWRLPTRSEWSATIAAAVAMNCVGQLNRPPSLTGDAGGCLSSGDTPFLGVPVDPRNDFSNWLTFLFWSSTGDHAMFPQAWYTDLYWGGLATGNKSNNGFRIWPVRGGSR